MSTWVFKTEDSVATAGFTDPVSGVHHCQLMGYKMGISKAGAETIVGHPTVIWNFKIIGGAADKARFYYETPLGGYFHSKRKPGQRVEADFISKQVIHALDPTIKTLKGVEIDFDALVNKECEMGIETKLNKDGTTSMWVKVLFVRPWVDPGVAGPSAVIDNTTDIPF